MGALGNRLNNSPRFLKILALVLVVFLLFLLGILVYLRFVSPTGAPTPTQVAVLTPTLPVSATPTPESIEAMQPTQTPVVRVSSEPEEAETLLTPVLSPEMEALDAPAQTATAASGMPAATPGAVSVRRGDVDNVLRNGDFSAGFQSNGVAVDWNNFNNSSAVFSFQPGDWPLVNDGQSQYMRIRDAQLSDRFLGIFQTAQVVPGETYTFTLRGLVRTGAGDVSQTDFGYRLQVGIDLEGGQDWRDVNDWVEMPWDEQLFEVEDPRIDEFSTVLTAGSDRLTVFVRAWKKWADPGEGVYDIVYVDLQGPGYVTVSSPAAAPETVDQPVQVQAMPVTGHAPATFWDHLSLWVTIALLLLLVGGAIWRLKWTQN